MKIGQTASIEQWDPAIYAAVVQDVVETVSSEQYGSKPRLQVVFRVSNDTGEYNDVWYYTNATLSRHPNATFRPLVAALRPDIDLDDPDLELDTGHAEGQPASPNDVLIGARCRVFLGVNAEKGRNVVDKVLPFQAPPRQARQPGPAAVAAAPAPTGAKAPF